MEEIEHIPNSQSAKVDDVDSSDTVTNEGPTAAKTVDDTTTTIPPTNNPTTSTDETVVATKISKNQLKRQQKWERAMAIKKRRKDQEKAIKQAKAEKEGRNIEEVKKIMEENRQAGIGRAKREEKWQRRFIKNASKFTICIDCSFEGQMLDRERKSLASQIRFCYSSNKQAKHPVEAKVTSLSGETLACLQNVSGYELWSTRGFETTEKDLFEVYDPNDNKSQLVYLTSDSEHTLETLEDGKVYIIGGIVDRNRLKCAALDRANTLGIPTAKLPITDHVNFTAPKVLTVNHVFDLLLRVREYGNDWKKALLSVLPERRDAKENNDDDDNC